MRIKCEENIKYLFKLRLRATKCITLLGGHGPLSPEVCRIFISFLIYLEIKAPPEQIILVLHNFFFPGIFLQVFNLTDSYFRRNIKKLKFI